VGSCGGRGGGLREVERERGKGEGAEGAGGMKGRGGLNERGADCEGLQE